MSVAAGTNQCTMRVERACRPGLVTGTPAPGETVVDQASWRRTALPPDIGQVVLVLQGGGALGAYQIGVYQALHDARIEPNWVIGTSIGQ
jgi:NTE family protein